MKEKGKPEYLQKNLQSGEKNQQQQELNPNHIGARQA